MNEKESTRIINEVKECYARITEHSEKAELDAFLAYYDDSPSFLSISADGKMSNYDEFKQACTEYYSALKGQRVTTIALQYQVIDANLVIVGWKGDIVATFKNGDIMKMNNYSITTVFRKIGGNWKVVHDHESALPPEIIMNEE